MLVQSLDAYVREQSLGHMAYVPKGWCDVHQSIGRCIWLVRLTLDLQVDMFTIKITLQKPIRLSCCINKHTRQQDISTIMWPIMIVIVKQLHALMCIVVTSTCIEHGGPEFQHLEHLSGVSMLYCMSHSMESHEIEHE